MLARCGDSKKKKRSEKKGNFPTPASARAHGLLLRRTTADAAPEEHPTPTSPEMSLDDLSFEHEEQLKQYLKFFRSKRGYQIQEVEACFADQLDVLNEDMYTKDEIRRSYTSLCKAVRSSVLTDLQMTANMSMLVLRQLLEEAEASEIDMDLDMTIVEDHSLLAEAGKAEASLAAEVRAAGSSKPVTTIWQRAGVHRGETEQEMSARVRSGELDAVRGGMQALASFAPRQPLQYLEQYASALVIGTAGLLGALYGGARGYARAWWMDVTPSVCRELAGHVAMRSAIGSMLLVGFFEAAPWLKKQALTSANRKEVDDFRHPEALSQLVAVDLAYLGAIAAVNFLFPYVLIPVALNPAQLLVLPSDAPPPPPPQRIADAQADAAK